MKIGIIGAGSWGTALAWYLAKLKHKITLWCYENQLAAKIQNSRINNIYLPGVNLPNNIIVTTDLPLTARDSDLIILAVPVQFLRGVLARVKWHIKRTPILDVAKGIEVNSRLFISGILNQEFGEDWSSNYACLSGPTFAKEVSRGLPTAACAASKNFELAKLIQKVFISDVFRIYTTDDVIGVEVGGALKNIIAIAAGISDGLNFGQNARAALIVRGLHEIKKIGVALGAKDQTFSYLSGLGDLVLTCSSELSRNRMIGFYVGQGFCLADAYKKIGSMMVAEGVATSRAAVELSKKLGIEMPITKQVYQVLFGNKPPQKACQELMGREPKEESCF